jgi:hypothetical protein
MRTSIQPGQRFGRWTVLRWSHFEPKSKSYYWLCRCDCGTERAVRGSHLIGGSRSCGCVRRELFNEMQKHRSLIKPGQRFGRLTAISRQHKNPNGAYYWLFRCDCGIEKLIRGTHLNFGVVRSCGCLNIELSSARLAKFNQTRPGYSKTPTFAVWSNMKQRCLRPSHPLYYLYGARGITVCERWLKYENFLADMGKRPPGQLTIERIDNDGPYSPENCRWATYKEQANNRRNTKFLTFQGETRPVQEWIEQLGLPASTVWNRIARGWPTEKVLSSSKLDAEYQRTKPYCKHGHPLSGDNLHIYKSRKGKEYRICRACSRNNLRASRRRAATPAP